MEQTIQNIAALVAIIFAPIGCWLAYKNIPKDKQAEVINEFKYAKNIIIFFLVLLSLSVSLFFEITSPEPLTRLAVAKMCFYSSFIIVWTFLHALLFVLKLMQAHTSITARHLNVTALITDHFREVER
jgi:hypothetical protein